jgi:hypothetical protein
MNEFSHGFAETRRPQPTHFSFLFLYRGGTLIEGQALTLCAFFKYVSPLTVSRCSSVSPASNSF